MPVMNRMIGVSPEDLIALDDALQEFEAIDPMREGVVKLHYYSGFTLQETAEALGTSLRTSGDSGSLRDRGYLEKCATAEAIEARFRLTDRCSRFGWGYWADDRNVPGL
jgi:ECF sigma factor